MAEEKTGIMATLSGSAGKWIGIGLLAGGLALGTWAVIKSGKKKPAQLSGVGKKKSKKSGKHTCGKKCKSNKARYMIKGFGC